MLVREVLTDAKTGETTERWVEIPDVLTAEEGLALTTAQAIAEQNASIIAQLAANDLKAIRAVVENDQPRLAQHRKDQEALRKLLK